MSTVLQDKLSCQVSTAQVLVSVPQQITVTDPNDNDTFASYTQTIIKKVPTTIQKVTLNGCSLNEVNGRYLESGNLHGARKFTNVNGWNIFRYALEEIPELDILAKNCYKPLAGTQGDESLMERMSKRVDGAISEIIDYDSQLVDGSASFKRTFAELSRTGHRMITVDHQMDVIHVENLRASVRIQSDEEAMLAISLAASIVKNIEEGTSSSSNQNNNNNNDSDNDNDNSKYFFLFYLSRSPSI